MVASHCKSVAKSITWRVLGAADTFVLSFLVTGKATAACGIVGFELLTKSILYYGHERAWEMQGRWQWAAPMYQRFASRTGRRRAPWTRREAIIAWRRTA